MCFLIFYLNSDRLFDLVDLASDLVWELTSDDLAGDFASDFYLIEIDKLAMEGVSLLLLSKYSLYSLLS